MTAQPILLVEDNPDDEALTLRAFAKSNISNEVVVARDGAEALAYLSRTRLIPVVVLTSSKQDEDILDSYRSGANAYVRKPVKFSDFADAVRALGAFWLLLNEPAPSRGRNRIEVGQL
jgi:two-component system, response regulator